jgi:cytochrome d ubiquinol oxidase subunit II
VLGGAAILFPSLAILFRLTLTGRLDGVETAVSGNAGQLHRGVSSALLVRSAIACLIIGAGLLNLANAAWTHAIGVACLIGFIVIAARAIIPAALGELRLTR